MDIHFIYTNVEKRRVELANLGKKRYSVLLITNIKTNCDVESADKYPFA